METPAHTIQIVTAEHGFAADCVESLDDSGIGVRYFSDRQSTLDLVLAGIDRKEIFIANDANGAVMGFYWATGRGMFCRFSYLRLLAIKPGFRNAGVGKKLLDHFEENGFARARKVFLAVSDFNTDAQRFYAKNGYIRIGAVPDLYKPGIAEILMMKSLP